MVSLPKTEEELCVFALGSGSVTHVTRHQIVEWVEYLSKHFPGYVEIHRSQRDHHVYNFKVICYRVCVCGHTIDLATGTYGVADDSFYVYNKIYHNQVSRMLRQQERERTNL